MREMTRRDDDAVYVDVCTMQVMSRKARRLTRTFDGKLRFAVTGGPEGDRKSPVFRVSPRRRDGALESPPTGTPAVHTQGDCPVDRPSDSHAQHTQAGNEQVARDVLWLQRGMRLGRGLFYAASTTNAYAIVRRVAEERDPALEPPPSTSPSESPLL